MKILIAGGAGFIGSHLCEKLLKDDHQIVCVDNLLTGSEKNIADLKTNSNFSFISHNIIKPLNFDQKIDAVFHLASPASPNHHSKLSYHALPIETMLANTSGTLELLKFAKKNQAKFLFASTSEVYGDPEKHPQSEDYRGNTSTTGPRSVYDESKRFGETLTAYFWRKEGVDGRVARIFNTYGPRMLKDDMRMLVNFIHQAVTGKPITIYGNGKQTRSLCYIDDMVKGLTRLMFYPKTKAKIVNLGSTQEHTVLEYAQLVKKITSSTSKIVFTEGLPPDDPKRRQPDISKAKKILNWRPKISLEEGIKKMVIYFKNNF
ncbi:NAD-dependent dehydratase [Candidatus Roizmanbacteria bacterium CG02_land_8_20_14_3_00_36_15]|uniref:NAD-dependent dehydratase n=2 Tax=Candidatus Roizmaniibacteriota TaxID=1752723 RepID=A0A2M8KLR4_9BACT|nr:MAG: NAD-dependent dehydratase [Candidatus Roizmanbacteria bacterium CG03_land_8_20_14_0_80_36_21]PIV37914.1 MAG: NAD-dependent dehydratase [Candidatus Roizmanbacteria bacterium CG02_land_8_20_14_3_00_36_15]PIY69884.1 MAG: NAD-dependent dehydratase [Candidatus Roizmanbacteria bacterium CG_4_10_14_0_8_um_filter_36_36]PJA53890.1 MAG: NAD-dependent dehydratase [Candidatus Roizmanbacteria bacterium CG_4_9_14_3_um_filter_36_11]PJE60849.1 MAG: NAD-dependent dehydratase [Candidatus Roizmanbacteria 